MNYSEVKELLQAGFTVAEIRTMMNPQENNPQNTQDNPQAENTNNFNTVTMNSSVDQPELKQPEEQPQPVQPEEKQDDTKFNQLNATMEKLIKTIQLSNLNNNSFDHMKETDINAEVDKIMGSIIRPERKEGGSN